MTTPPIYFRPDRFLLMLFMAVNLAAQAQVLPDDAYLYYRRTHNGNWPSSVADSSDHSNETTNTVPAPKHTPPASQPASLLDNGVDPANLGKGDWIWQMSACTNGSTIPGVNSAQTLINYEKSQGMQWITVKCGDGGGLYPSASSPQFTADLVTRAHNAGLKIFGWAYAYGNNVSGEINVALNALSLGADGFIIDAESEYEVLAGNDAAAAAYCQGIRASYPTRFLAHAPFPIISGHSGFPYKTFGTNCDAVMPQAYWADIGGTGYAVTMVTRMNSEWRNWQNGLSGVFTNAIKPIVPIGQAYNSVNGNVDGSQITNFVNALKTNSPSATAGGYKGLSWWSCQHHGVAPDKWPAIGGTSLGPPAILSQPSSRYADRNSSITLTVSASGLAPLQYQWRLNGTNVPNATNAIYTLNNVQTNHAGNYLVVVTNSLGSVTSSVAVLTVNPLFTPLFSDNFDTDSSANWTLNRSTTDTRVSFAYNHAALGIPSAPNSTGGTTKAVRFEANLTLTTAAALNISPVGQSFIGNYRLHFDMWINANGPFPAGGTGSTEHLTAGLGTAGNRVQWTGSGTTADGAWFATDGEGQATDTSATLPDWRAYVGTTLQTIASGVYSGGVGANVRGNNDPYYSNVFPGGQTAPAAQQSTYPQQTGGLDVGTVGFAWRDVVINKNGNIVEWFIDGLKIASLTNVSFTSSNIFIGYWDSFNSLSDNTNLSFGLVDNLRVEVPAIAPTFSLQPSNIAVKVTSNAMFTVTASGVPAPGYQWQLNSSPIAGATNAVFTRANVQTNDAGIYSVVITNIAGSVTSSNAALTILPASPAQFQLVALQPDNTLQLTASGDSGAVYFIEASTNLFDWVPFTNLMATNGAFTFNAGPATNEQRFFRARSGP